MDDFFEIAQVAADALGVTNEGNQYSFFNPKDIDLD